MGHLTPGSGPREGSAEKCGWPKEDYRGKRKFWSRVVYPTKYVGPFTSKTVPNFDIRFVYCVYC